LKRKIYAIELLQKIVSEEELSILEVSSDDELTIDEKISILVKGEKIVRV
jgi:hypothetical protein